MQPVLSNAELIGTPLGSAEVVSGQIVQPVRRRVIPATLSFESVAYLTMIVLAAFSRFWNLGSKALHHDESLHAYYSWVLYKGDGYVHDPLMHGPFLFHANALVYFLFGDTDATSRYLPALFGVILVALPILLRGPQFLGRWGALSAAFFLLISPSILYQSRYLRHDIYTIVGTLLLFICVVRYVDQPKRGWLVLGAATIAFLLTNHEIIFAILAIFGGYLYGAVMVERFAALRQSNRSLALALLLAHVGVLVAVAILYLAVPDSTRSELLVIPWDNPSQAQEREYYRTVFTNPFFLGLLAIIGAFLISLFLIFRQAGKTSLADAESPVVAAPEAGSATAAVEAAWYDKTGLMLAVGAALLIFVPLYTSLFQNMDGLASSTIATDGTLLYWLGQHDFRRGEQPWFYFLLMMPQYEFIAVVIGGFFAAIVTWQTVFGLFRPTVARRRFFNLFLVVWYVLIFAGLSYAGEKMPWLIIHIALPGILLSAAAVDHLVESVRRRDLFPFIDQGWNAAAVVTLIVIAFFAFFWKAAPLTYGEFIADGDGSRGGIRRVASASAADQWWQLAIPGLLIVLLLVALAWRRGSAVSGVTAFAGVVIVLSLMQIHTGWRLSYYEPDVPKDMLVYTQTSPDVTRVMDEIDELSAQLTGGDHLEVVYDSQVSWPFQWYLRNYDQKRFVGSALAGPNENAPVVLLGGSAPTSEQFLENYTSVEYVLRWWFPEETYRGFAIAPELPPGRSAWQSIDEPHGPVDVARSIWDSVENQSNIDNQLRLYRLIAYRDLDHRLGQTNFRVYVRNDLLPLYDTIRY